MFNGEAFGQQMVEIVRGYVDGATAPLMARIDALEKRELLLPEKGDPGADGLPGMDGADGAPGAAGEPGKDGVGLADAVKDADGNLILVMTDGRTKNIGPVNGCDGRDGETFTLDDFDIEPLDERTIKMGFTKGDVKHSFELAIPVPIYRGVFKDGEVYERGDMTTWAGSLWHSNEPKGLKPGAPDSGWQLAAKAGRPGKDAK